MADLQRTRTDAPAVGTIGTPQAPIDTTAQALALRIAERRHHSHDPSTPPPGGTNRGQRAADTVTAFGGSWTFVGLFGLVTIGWVGLNGLLVWRIGRAFDPYPFILLNLVLSMLAAVQAPVILMSQNRQAERDRQSAGHDYDVNLKAELEIMLLHEKIDRLRQEQWAELLAIQREQTRLLSALVADKGVSAAP